MRTAAVAFSVLAAWIGVAHRAYGQYPPEIRGQVLDALSAASLPNADVSLSDGAKTLTAADGSFVLRALRPGPTELVVHRIGYAPKRYPIELENGRVETIALELTPKAVALPELAAEAERSAAGTTVIDRARIARAGAADLGDILQQEAGAVVTRRGGPASPATVSIRGSGADQVLVLVDGVPLNDPLTGQADLSLVALSAVERVTVLRGAQSARYGPRALGGVIAVETSRANGGEVQATFGAGSWGTRHGAARMATGGGDRRQVAATLGAEWQVFGGAFPVTLPAERGGGTGIRDNADADALTLDGSIGFEGTRLGSRLQAEFFDVTRGMPGTVVQPSLSARQSQQRINIGTESRMRFGTGTATLGLTVQRQDATFTDSAPPFGAPYDQRTRATTLVGTATVMRLLAGSDVSAGVEVRRLAVTSNTLADAARDAIEFGGLWSTLHSPSLTGGRWQIDASASGRVDIASLAPGAFVSPQIMLNIRRGRLGGELRWARAYNPPSLADLFFQEGVQVKPNPDLKPERVRNEWTATVTARSLAIGPFRSEVSAAAYVADVSGMIIWSPDFRYIWSPDNFDVRRRGVELNVRLVPHIDRFALVGSAALTDVQYTGPVLSGQVIYRPRWSAALSAETQVFGVDSRLSYRYVGARPTAIGSDLNTLQPIHLLDLHLVREVLVGRLRLRMGGVVENLLDTHAGMLIDYPFPGRLVRAEVTFSHPLGDI